MQALLIFAAGVLFAVGLGISGMTDANKVIAFLDFTGAWDPSLAFVMVGAIGVHAVANRWIRGTPRPLFAPAFPAVRNDVTRRLVVGATVFGAGGPIYATYLSGRLKDKTALRATISTLISISAFSRAIVYAIGGLLLHLTILGGMVVLAPFVWLGLRIGTRIHLGLTQEQMRRAIGVLLTITGATLLVRSLL